MGSGATTCATSRRSGARCASAVSSSSGRWSTWRHPARGRCRRWCGGAARLWERRPADPGFGCVRLAVGDRRPWPMRLVAAVSTKPVEDLEPLTAGALRRFIRAYATVPDLPVAIYLRACGPDRAHAATARAAPGAGPRGDRPTGGLPRARGPADRVCVARRAAGRLGVGQVAAAQPAPAPRATAAGPVAADRAQALERPARAELSGPAPVRPARGPGAAGPEPCTLIVVVDGTGRPGTRRRPGRHRRRGVTDLDLTRRRGLRRAAPRCAWT